MPSLTSMKSHTMRKHACTHTYIYTDAFTHFYEMTYYAETCIYIYAFTHSYEITDYAETCANHLYMYIGILALS